MITLKSSPMTTQEGGGTKVPIHVKLLKPQPKTKNIDRID
jgi:hypothetical protein